EVLEPHHLDLQPRGARPGVATEDLEDDRGPIHDLGAGGLLEVARLRRADLVIHEDQIRRAALDHARQLLALTGSDHRSRIERVAPLGDGWFNHFDPERLRETAQLRQRLGVLLIAYSRKLN